MLFLANSQNAVWKNDIRGIPNSNFFQLYHYFAVITEKYNGDLLQRTSYKRILLGSYQNYELFIHVHSKVKLSMKSKFYNVIAKLIRESENIIAAACICPAESSVKRLGKSNHADAIIFALEDFNRKNFALVLDINWQRYH